MTYATDLDPAGEAAKDAADSATRGSLHAVAEQMRTAVLAGTELDLWRSVAVLTNRAAWAATMAARIHRATHREIEAVVGEEPP